MAYLGRGLDKISNIEVLDNITFDGSSSYSITKGSVAFTPNSAQSCLISIDGVVQATNFTVSSSTIDFGVAIPSTSTCNFFLHYGTGLITVPADGTVTNAKLASGSFSNITDVGTLSSGLTLSDNILFDTASKGIYLGVTSATSSNLLDDYEEGTWTPTAVGGVTGFTVLSADYIKIGETITIRAYLNSFSGAGASQLVIGGLPFSSGSDGYWLGVLEGGASGSSSKMGVLRTGSGGTNLNCFYPNTSNANRTNYLGNDLGNFLILSLTYTTT